VVRKTPQPNILVRFFANTADTFTQRLAAVMLVSNRTNSPAILFRQSCLSYLIKM